MKVYGASKLFYSEMWKELKEAWPEVEFTARWPWEHVGKTPDTQAFATLFWIHDEEDVRAADVVLVYALPDDILRGALVEAGMAIALGKKVLLIGENPSYGSWQYHPRVYRVPTLDAARTLLNYWETHK